MRNRARLGLVGLLLCFVIAAFGPAVSARAAETSSNPTQECNTDGRAVCVHVTTFQNITASQPTISNGNRFTWVEWQVRNAGGTSLTHPTTTLRFQDICGAVNCSGASTVSLVAPLPANCSTSTGNLVCEYPNLPANTPGPTTRVFFKTANLPATASRITVTATVNERGSDAGSTPNCDPSDPNCDTWPVSVVNSYEPEDDNAYTFALSGNRFNLPTNDGSASITFTSSTSANPANTLTTFKKLPATDTADFCFSDVECYDRVLFADTGGIQTFGSGNPVVFYARLFDPPVTQNKISAIHIYDATGFTLVSNSRIKPTTSTLDFSKMDGVEFKTTTFGQPAKKYFIVPNSYSSGDKSFQLSATKGGAAITTLTGTTGTGNPIRIIGDQSDERSTTLCTLAPQTSLTGPKICVTKIANKVFDSYVWDLGNGWIIH